MLAQVSEKIGGKGIGKLEYFGIFRALPYALINLENDATKLGYV